jgi:hypothetical protein
VSVACTVDWSSDQHNQHGWRHIAYQNQSGIFGCWCWTSWLQVALRQSSFCSRSTRQPLSRLFSSHHGQGRNIMTQSARYIMWLKRSCGMWQPHTVQMSVWSL